MTVPVENGSIKYNGNGVVTAWNFTFSFKEKEQIVVYVRLEGESRGNIIPSVDYDLTSPNSGGTVTYPKSGEGDPLTANDIISIVRESKIKQILDLSNVARVNPEDLEDELDNEIRISQEINTSIARCIQVDPTAESTPEELLESIYSAEINSAASAAAASSSEANAAMSAQEAAMSAQEAADSATSINLPATPVDGDFLKFNSTSGGYEGKTPAEVLTDIGAVDSVVAGSGIGVDNTDAENPVISTEYADGYIKGGTYTNSIASPLSIIDISAVKARSSDNTKDINVPAGSLDISLNASWADGMAKTVGILTPAMTSGDQDGFIVTSSSEQGTAYDWEIFDQTGLKGSEQGWGTSSTATATVEWLAVEMPVAKRVNIYRIGTPAVSNWTVPKSWELQGSNTGAWSGEETIVDTRTDEVLTETGIVYEYETTNPGSFLHYRLYVTNRKEVDNILIPSLDLLETEENSFYVWAVYDATTPYCTIDDKIGSNIAEEKRYCCKIVLNVSSEVTLVKYRLDGKKIKMEYIDEYNISSISGNTSEVIEFDDGNEKELRCEYDATNYQNTQFQYISDSNGKRLLKQGGNSLYDTTTNYYQDTFFTFEEEITHGVTPVGNARVFLMSENIYR